MAKRIVWSKNATIDRLQILDYWHKRIGAKSYSKKLDLEIRKLIRNLRVLPEMGRKLNNTHIRYLVKDHYLIFYSIHGNIRFPFLYDHGIMFSANFMQQGEFNRLDIGSLVQINQFLFGITAATNPARNSSNSHLLTSINTFVGLEYTDFRFGVSYDFNTSNIGSTNGVYELSITYLSRCRSCGLDRSRKR